MIYSGANYLKCTSDTGTHANVEVIKPKILL